jgi:hypothetical protein
MLQLVAAELLCQFLFSDVFSSFLHHHFELLLLRAPPPPPVALNKTSLVVTRALKMYIKLHRTISIGVCNKMIWLLIFTALFFVMVVSVAINYSGNSSSKPNHFKLRENYIDLNIKPIIILCGAWLSG